MIVVIENGKVVFSEEDVLNLDTLAENFPDVDTVIEYLYHNHYEQGSLPPLALRRLFVHALGLVQC